MKGRIIKRRDVKVGTRIVKAVEHEAVMLLDGHMLCGERVSKAEFDEFLRTGVVTSRILRGHTWPQPEELCPISGLPERMFSGDADDYDDEVRHPWE